MARRPAGLDATQLHDLGEKLRNGGRPRVQLSGPQFEPGTVGTVVRIGDPQTDGEDYVTVRARVGGVLDELAFSPAELSTPGSAAKSAAKAAAKPAARSANRSATARRASAAATPEKQTPAATTAPPPAAATPPPTAVPPTPAANSVAAKSVAAKSVARAAAARRTVPAAPVKITITSAGVSWTVSVEKGARTLMKGSVITPGAVTAIAALLDQDAVTSAVAGVNDAARIEAEARAENLRAELAQVQAILDSHQAP
jgi:hypothetical protein